MVSYCSISQHLNPELSRVTEGLNCVAAGPLYHTHNLLSVLETRTLQYPRVHDCRPLENRVITDFKISIVQSQYNSTGTCFTLGRVVCSPTITSRVKKNLSAFGEQANRLNSATMPILISKRETGNIKSIPETSNSIHQFLVFRIQQVIEGMWSMCGEEFVFNFANGVLLRYSTVAEIVANVFGSTHGRGCQSAMLWYEILVKLS
jgi:hypothetical protein